MSTNRNHTTIAIFLPSVNGGGAESAMLVFATELIRRRFSVDLVLARLEGALISRIPAGVRVVDLASPRMLKAIPGLVRYLREVRPKAIFSTITHANLVAMCASRFARIDSPVILRQSNTPLSETKDSWGRFIASRMIPYVYRWADGIIAVSEGVKEELLELDPDLAVRTHVLPTPVLTENVRQQSEEPCPHPWFNDSSVPVILSAGRLKPHKGMLDLLHAFSIVRERHRARLVILGDGPERARLEAEVLKLGLSQDVILPGFFSNPFVWMKYAAVFVLASHYEGLPNVLIQALAMGTPVVATDCPSGPAEILEFGKYGYLVPVGDPGKIADAIVRSLKTQKTPLAKDVVWRRYGAESATTNYLGLAGLSPMPLA